MSWEADAEYTLEKPITGPRRPGNCATCGAFLWQDPEGSPKECDSCASEQKGKAKRG